MKPLATNLLDAIHAAALKGTPARETAQRLRIRKDTVLKYQRLFFATREPPACGCGRLSTHAGQCKARIEARRQPVLMPGARLVRGRDARDLELR